MVQTVARPTGSNEALGVDHVDGVGLYWGSRIILNQTFLGLYKTLLLRFFYKPGDDKLLNNFSRRSCRSLDHCSHWKLRRREINKATFRYRYLVSGTWSYSADTIRRTSGDVTSGSKQSEIKYMCNRGQVSSPSTRLKCHIKKKINSQRISPN